MQSQVQSGNFSTCLKTGRCSLIDTWVLANSKISFTRSSFKFGTCVSFKLAFFTCYINLDQSGTFFFNNNISAMYLWFACPIDGRYILSSIWSIRTTSLLLLQRTLTWFIVSFTGGTIIWFNFYYLNYHSFLLHVLLTFSLEINQINVRMSSEKSINL